MHKGLYIIGLLFLLFVACTGDREMRAVLDRADAMMESCPDSAYAELQTLFDGKETSLLPLGEIREGLGRSDRSRAILLLADATNKLYKQMPSDTVFQEVVDYYDRHGDANERMKSYYLMGCIYRDRHEAPMALQWYLDAVEQADTLAADCDYFTLMKVYGQMADIYHSQLMPSAEIEAYRHFSKCAEMMDSTYYAIRGIEFQLDAYSILGDTTMVLALTDSVHDLYLQAGLPQAAASVYHAAIYIHLARHDFSKAKQLMDIFEQESGLFDVEGNISKGREHYYCAKGAYYKGIHKLDSAEYYYRKLLIYNYDYNAYKGLIQLFELRHQQDSLVVLV